MRVGYPDYILASVLKIPDGQARAVKRWRYWMAIRTLRASAWLIRWIAGPLRPVETPKP